MIARASGWMARGLHRTHQCVSKIVNIVEGCLHMYEVGGAVSFC